INAKAHDDITVLHEAVRNNHVDCVKLLLEHGADMFATTTGGKNIFHLMAENSALLAAMTAVPDAAATVNEQDMDGWTALFHAAATPLKEETRGRILTLLHEAGADWSHRSLSGQTVLHVAAAHGRERVVEEYLLRRRVNALLDCDEDDSLALDACDQSGSTALMLACQIPPVPLRVIQVMVANKADVNAGNHVGQTPLLMASRAGKEDVLLLLHTAGAQVNSLCDWGSSALWWSRQR
ncbi:hypothetical protein GUITHDRAFT_42381, partial [Guillardia theta CCMP2712]